MIKGSDSDQDVTPCLLCKAPENRPIQRLTGGELKKLWAVLGHTFSSGAFGPITGDYIVTLLECSRCGFRYFNPALAGTGQFYAELEGDKYYVSERPEFLRVERILAGREVGRLLDIGCGDGSFLDRARSMGWMTFGTELNTAAAKRGREKGHIISDVVTSMGADAKPQAFDVITAFQVFEHVADPVGMLANCRQLVRAGGLIAISVPFDSGVYRLTPWDPHQWPPHHVSRWRKLDLQNLGKAADVHVVSVVTDILYGAALEYFINLRGRLGSALGRAMMLQRFPALPKLISFIYRKTGMKYALPNWGQSAFALFKRPE